MTYERWGTGPWTVSYYDARGRRLADFDRGVPGGPTAIAHGSIAVARCEAQPGLCRVKRGAGPWIEVPKGADAVAVALGGRD